MTVQEYIDDLPVERKDAFLNIRQAIIENIPKGFEEVINYGMICFVVPHELYPSGYHCNPKDPLPFMSLASQKQSINLYHLGIYQDEKLMQWFVDEWGKISKYKLDMGKSCIRFKYENEIPYNTIKELVKKYTVIDWIKIYEEKIKR